MKTFLIGFAVFSSSLCYSQTNSNHVYVEGHYRTAPNSTVNDNFSTVGNVNPYTGEPGTVPRDIIYTNTIPDYDFATQTRHNSIKPIIIPKLEKPDYVEPYNPPSIKSPPVDEIDVSKPMYGVKDEGSLWKSTTDKRPSIEQMSVAPNAVPNKKIESDALETYWFLGGFLLLVSLVFLGYKRTF